MHACTATKPQTELRAIRCMRELNGRDRGAQTFFTFWMTLYLLDARGCAHGSVWALLDLFDARSDISRQNLLQIVLCSLSHLFTHLKTTQLELKADLYKLKQSK